jgi:3-dehydroquinate synthase
MLSGIIDKQNIEVLKDLFSKESFFETCATLGSPVVIITDENVEKLYGKKILKAFLQRGIQCSLISFPAGEENKTREVKQEIEDQLIAMKAGRNTLLIGLGGGVVTDITGFLAATFLRGVSLVLIPTTLLAMVDASLGGKNGVNTPKGKNLIGSFYFPQRTWIDVSFLKTLDHQEKLYGLVETIKHSLIADLGLFEELEMLSLPQLWTEEDKLESLIARSAFIKTTIVEKDTLDHSIRKLLNFGHTIGHGIESISNYKIAHGQGVAIGCLLESWYSWKYENLPYEDLLRIERCFDRLSIDCSWPRDLDIEDVLEAMQMDKKVKESKIHLPILERIGQAKFNGGEYSQEIQPHRFIDGVNWLKNLRSVMSG